jgi:hypothetical protein
MDTLFLTPEVAQFLSEIKERTELLDDSGNLVGIFSPKQEAEAELIAEAREIFDLEEARRRLASEKPGRTTQEVLQRLKSLEPSK